MNFQGELFRCPNVSVMTQRAAAAAIAQEIAKETGAVTPEKTILNWIRGERDPLRKPESVTAKIALKALKAVEANQAKKTASSPLNQTRLKVGRLA